MSAGSVSRFHSERPERRTRPAAFKDGPNWRSWKSFEWNVTDRLYEAGYITDPKGKAKSVVLTPEGLERGLALCEELFDLS